MDKPITIEEVDQEFGEDMGYWMAMIVEVLQDPNADHLELVQSILKRCREDAIQRYINNQTKH